MPTGRKKASKKTLVQRITSPQFRDLALASIPVAYGFGFFVWALYAASKGLGFLPLSSPRYLAVGLVFGPYLVGALGTIPWFVKNMKRESKRTHFVRVHLLASFLTTMLAFLILVSIPSVLQVFSLDWKATLAGYLVAPLAALFAAVVWIGHRGLATLYGKTKEGRKAADRFDALAKPANKEHGPFLLYYYSFLGLALLAICSVVFLPAMQPEFGGAKIRHAVLEIPRDGLSTALGDALWDPDQNMSAAVLRTKLVSVYYYDEQSFLVRTPPREDGRGPLYEIERSQVHAVQWWD